MQLSGAVQGVDVDGVLVERKGRQAG